MDGWKRATKSINWRKFNYIYKMQFESIEEDDNENDDDEKLITNPSFCE